jgi:transposase
MDDSTLQLFFLQPSCPQQRQYEALRAVFVDGISQKEAAQRFGYSYGSFRLLVHQFRSACSGGSPPPFSTRHREAARPASRQPSDLTSQPSPTPAL